MGGGYRAGCRGVPARRWGRGGPRPRPLRAAPRLPAGARPCPAAAGRSLQAAGTSCFERRPCALQRGRLRLPAPWGRLGPSGRGRLRLPAPWGQAHRPPDCTSQRARQRTWRRRGGDGSGSRAARAGAAGGGRARRKSGPAGAPSCERPPSCAGGGGSSPALRGGVAVAPPSPALSPPSCCRGAMSAESPEPASAEEQKVGGWPAGRQAPPRSGRRPAGLLPPPSAR